MFNYNFYYKEAKHSCSLNNKNANSLFISIFRIINFSEYNLVWQLCINKQGSLDLRLLQQVIEARTQSVLYSTETKGRRILRSEEEGSHAVCLLIGFIQRKRKVPHIFKPENSDTAWNKEPIKVSLLALHRQWNIAVLSALMFILKGLAPRFLRNTFGVVKLTRSF